VIESDPRDNIGPMRIFVDRQSYIEQEIVKMLQSWGSFAAVGGSFVILALSALDYFVTRAHFLEFLVYRLATVFVLCIIFFLNKKKASRSYQIGLFMVATFAVSIMVELMILSFGGHQSSYYAGMIIVLIISLGFLPISSIIVTAAFAIGIYAIYLVPILFFDRITNLPLLINNNVFLITTALIAVAWRHYNDSLYVRKLSLEYDLSQDKEKLQKYSTQLEELVAERTKELALSEQKYKALFDNANDGIVVLDKNGTIVSVNNSYCELYGFERGTLIGTSFKLLEAKDSEAKVRERMGRILGGESLVYETEHYKRDGNKILVEISSRAINIGGELYVQSFHRDIAEKKRLQEQLFQSQKMESIGVLAGGIAHDFNNILTAILAHTDMLQEFSNLDAAGKKRVKTIEMSARRAGQLVSKLLRFARQASFDAVPIDLNAIVRDSAELIERMVKKQHIVLKVETTDASSVVQGDSTQIEQVIMNLVVNAGDAMPHGGTITISTTVENLGRDASRVHPLLTPGRYVRLVVSDTGMGIPEQIRDKIFDPFFTTKETGKGTGLGLATVYGIVKEHKGVINLRTEVGRGTTFEIFFPASRATPLSPVTIHTTGKGPFSGEQEKT
jgi:PAS domain S-box-containing protein